MPRARPPTTSGKPEQAANGQPLKGAGSSVVVALAAATPGRQSELMAPSHQLAHCLPRSGPSAGTQSAGDASALQAPRAAQPQHDSLCCWGPLLYHTLHKHLLDVTVDRREIPLAGRFGCGLACAPKGLLPAAQRTFSGATHGVPRTPT